MNIRAMTITDFEAINRLHNKYYHEFEFPRFSHMLNAFVIEDDDKSIVMAGGVEKVAEAVLVTNKEKSRIKIGKALVEAQQCAAYTCKRNDIRDMYAFVKDEQYAKHLLQHGFSPCDRALLMRVS
jgi:hypothetical protein